MAVLRLLVLVLVMSVAACGTNGSSSSAAPSTPSTTTSTTTTTTTTRSTPVTSPTSGAGSARPMTLTGTVADGVEAGCLVLQTADRTWTLVGKTTGLRAEDTVTVRGVPLPDLMSYCQQGEAFRVDEVLRG